MRPFAKTAFLAFAALAFLPSVGCATAPTNCPVRLKRAGRPIILDFVKQRDYSGISCIGGDEYVIACDKTRKGEVPRATLKFDDETGALLSFDEGESIKVEAGKSYDVEDIAFDPLRGSFWLSDERYNSIREFTMDGKYVRDAAVPGSYTNFFADNRSFEALTISPDGKTMWTANEEALRHDGPRSGKDRPTTVRMQRFMRDGADGEWAPAGQWAYECDAPEDSIADEGDYCLCGVSALAALPNGGLLVLERECSLSTKGRNRIYMPSFINATDVSGIASLTNGVPFVKAEKGAPLAEVRDGGGFLLNFDIAIYEGMCLGRRHSDGSYALVLVADGGWTTHRSHATARTRALVRAFKLFIEEGEEKEK